MPLIWKEWLDARLDEMLTLNDPVAALLTN
jgi:hypothetical protein